jgi:hypothetical protein
MFQPRYLDLKSAAVRYCTSRSSLYLLIKKGHVKAVKRGGRTLVFVPSVDAYFEALPEAKLGR